MPELQRREALRLLAAGLPVAVSGCLGGDGGGETTTTGEVSLVDTEAVDTTTGSSTGTETAGEPSTVTSAPATGDETSPTTSTPGATATTSGATTTPAPGSEWNYADWLPAPSPLGTDGLYRFTRVDGATVAANEQYIASDAYDFYKKGLEFQVKPTGIAMSAMSMLLFQDIRVVTGEFTTETVTERLTNSGYTKRQDYQGYAVYKNANTGHSVGVAGNTMVWNRNTEGTDRAGTVEVAVDAKRGAVSRLAAAGSAVADLLAALGDGVLISGQAPEGEWVVQGAGVTIDGETTELRDARVYENADAVDLQAFENDLQQVKERDGVQSVSTKADGRVAIATIVGDTATYGSTVLKRLLA